MLHQQLSIKDALRIPEAQKALDDEWAKLPKLHQQRVWIMESVREYNEVKGSAQRENRTIHFGRIFIFCIKSMRSWHQNSGNIKVG